MIADAHAPEGGTADPIRPWRRNPLRTRAHCLYDVFVGLLVAALCALPLLGYVAARAQLDDTEARRRTAVAENRAVPAVLEQNVHSVGRSPGRSGPTKARVTWTVTDGTSRTDRAPVASTGYKGDAVTIWLDRSGSPVAAPIAHSRLLVDAIGLGMLCVIGGLGVLLVLYAGGRTVFMRTRMEAWAREWQQTGPAWADRTT
ncbi:Rv1733c family protein [Yinghuangia soli]|uniref:Integral membrane protein n=1 Tax=Yinghuangia soli TaxID=2908204 RepID=A0AA41U0W9_9ACTN|nr:hypothetical protein [Yinghuangia soli]MCF2528915.1 hypothetical protein [Yinghuangia soli]